MDSPTPINSRVPKYSFWLMPLLVLLSGFCGISYEILYTRLLGNMLGNQFTINATVLLTFLLGIGVGALYAHRFRQWLWLIQACIGIYALFMALGYSSIDNFIYQSLPFLGVNLLASAAVCFVLLLIPAFFVGCSLPLFASYLSMTGASSVFSLTYALYSLGAAIAVIVMEFYLVREFGLQFTSLLLAGLNFFVAFALLWLMPKINVKIEMPESFYRFPRRILFALAIASIASAIFQLLMMKVGTFAFGPFNETFSLVLAMVLIGLSIGSILCNRFALSFKGALIIALVGIVWLLFIHPFAITWYATLYPAAVDSYALHVLLKFALIALLMALPAIGFGATIPALLGSYKDVAYESGQLLFWSATANALGFCLMAFVLHQRLDYGVILLVIAALVVTAIVIHSGIKHKAMLLLGGLGALSVVNYSYAWNELLLYTGHKNLHSLEDLEEELDQRFYADRFKGPQDVFAITYRGDTPYFFINGYTSAALSSPSEKQVGAISAMLAPRADKALVLGMGTGASASSIGLVFDSTDAVEINKAVLDNLYRMKDYNLEVEKNPKVNIVHDDGIHHLKTTEQQYSLMLNTATSPLYFSSSKLYTADFFELVKKKLTPDGVYVTSIDWHVGQRGLDIILETLDQSFEECWLAYTTQNYFLLACSQSPIDVRQFERVANQPVLREHFANEFELPLDLLPYAVIETDLLKLKSTSPTPINTLDQPILEFEMARLRGYDGLREFKHRLSEEQNIAEIQRRISKNVDWNAGEFIYYADMRLSSKSQLYHLILNNTRNQLGTTMGDYSAAAVTVADTLGTARDYYEHGEQLYDRELYSNAARLLKKAVQMRPDNADAWYMLGRSQYEILDFHGARTSLETASKLGIDRNESKWLLKANLKIKAENRTTSSQDRYFKKWKELCDSNAHFQGEMTFPTDGQDSFAGKLLIADATACKNNRVRVSFMVGDDRSRTWVFTNTANGLQLQHDHRLKNGMPDPINLYGGMATTDGTSLGQSFPADAHTANIIPEAATNNWTITFSDDMQRLTYHLERHGKPRFTAVLHRADR